MTTHYNAQFGGSSPHSAEAFSAAPSGLGDWAGPLATVLAGVSQGVGSALQKPTSAGIGYLADNKRAAKEAKMRVKAGLLNQAREHSDQLGRMGRQHADETRDVQAQAMQQVARGFVEALRGSTN